MYNMVDPRKFINLPRFLMMGWLVVCFLLNPLADDSGLLVLFDRLYQSHNQGETFPHFETHHHEDDLPPLFQDVRSEQGLFTINSRLNLLSAASNTPVPLLPPPKTK